jgi:alpha-beta hydrolase superfamily lysophospholipase
LAKIPKVFDEIHVVAASSTSANETKKPLPARHRMVNVSCPVLFIHGASDSLIPVEHSKTLFGLCRSRKLLVTPAKMDHNSSMFSDPKLWLKLRDFEINASKTIITHPKNHHKWVVYIIPKWVVYGIVFPTLIGLKTPRV